MAPRITDHIPSITFRQLFGGELEYEHFVAPLAIERINKRARADTVHLPHAVGQEDRAITAYRRVQGKYKDRNYKGT